MNKIKIFSLLVANYNTAIKFYTQKLGFEMLKNKTFNNNH